MLPPLPPSSPFPVFWALFTTCFDYTLIKPSFDSLSAVPQLRHAVCDPSSATPRVVTSLFVVAVVLLEFLLGFTVALMLNTVERGKTVY